MRLHQPGTTTEHTPNAKNVRHNTFTVHISTPRSADTVIAWLLLG
jgi:hypothetical protein